MSIFYGHTESNYMLNGIITTSYQVNTWPGLIEYGTRTDTVGMALPTTTFYGVKMANRTDYTNTGWNLAFNRYRLSQILSGTGGFTSGRPGRPPPARGR